MLIRFVEERFDRLAALKWRGARMREKLRALAVPAVFVACFALAAFASFIDWSVYLDFTGRRAMNKSYGAIGYFASSPDYADADFIINIDNPFAQSSSVYYAPVGRTYHCDNAGIKGLRTPPELRLMKDSFSPGDIYIASPRLERSIATTNADVMFRNGDISIHELGARSLIQYYYGGMSNEMTQVVTRHGEEEFFRAVEDNSVFLDYLAYEAVSADVSFSFYNFRDRPCAVRVYFEGEPAGEFAEEKYFIRVNLPGLRFKPGANRISFEFDGDVSELALAGVTFD
jgi:hypothetical protein